LFHQGIRIIKELRELSNGKYPTWSIWENVAGALSSNNGADFGEVLYEMDEAGACFSEWSMLDAQYFGVPQRRRRVFVLSCFDPAIASRSPEKILTVGESSGGNSAPSKPKGQSATTEASESFGAGSQSGYTDSNGVLRGTVTSKWAKGNGGPSGDEAYNLVVENPILIDRAAFNQGINAMYEPVISDDPVIPTIVARGPHAVCHDDLLC
jgi:DNA (cytosine-5)-methyltransferase 1